MSNLRVAMVVPTYNGGDIWKKSAASIRNYFSGDVLVIDSGSKDDTVGIANEMGFSVLGINSCDFNHGGTRNLGLRQLASSSDIVFFMTQDAILNDAESIENMIAMFDADAQLAAIYGKQIPHDDANVIARHARHFNYSDRSYVVSKESSKPLGIKAVFMSNSFSAYRVALFEKLGGFAENTILCEDMLFAANALSAGYKVGYAANAVAKHSHNYTAIDEFSRYFDIGVFHQEQSWIRRDFGGAGGEGKKFILSEMRFVLKRQPLYLIQAFINNGAKFLGYQLGKRYKRLPLSLSKKFSMHKKYWK
ncbi:glycosyltransferase family 2 protein [Enterobacter soli]|uniref:glycosyltransferase family 2 protein n=1 Tax=Enterobacter soli TaxID=885040 RepID=UPI0034CFD434